MEHYWILYFSHSSISSVFNMPHVFITSTIYIKAEDLGSQKTWDSEEENKWTRTAKVIEKRISHQLLEMCRQMHKLFLWTFGEDGIDNSESSCSCFIDSANSNRRGSSRVAFAWALTLGSGWHYLMYFRHPLWEIPVTYYWRSWLAGFTFNKVPNMRRQW